MHDLFREKRSLKKGENLSRDLVCQIYIRGAHQKVVVVTDNPLGLLASVKKQWNRLMLQVRRERSSALRVSRIAELSDQIAWMDRTTFSHKTENGLLVANVTFANAATFVGNSQDCKAMYVIEPVKDDTLLEITSNMSPGGLLVQYDQNIK